MRREDAANIILSRSSPEAARVQRTTVSERAYQAPYTGGARNPDTNAMNSKPEDVVTHLAACFGSAFLTTGVPFVNAIVVGTWQA